MPKQARDGGKVDGDLCREELLWNLEPKFWSDAGWAAAKGNVRKCGDDGIGVGYVGGGSKPARPRMA